jgi:hypothetical protein
MCILGVSAKTGHPVLGRGRLVSTVGEFQSCFTLYFPKLKENYVSKLNAYGIKKKSAK